jgi:hypothetical protein
MWVQRYTKIFTKQLKNNHRNVVEPDLRSGSTTPLLHIHNQYCLLSQIPRILNEEIVYLQLPERDWKNQVPSIVRQ